MNQENITLLSNSVHHNTQKIVQQYILQPTEYEINSGVYNIITNTFNSSSNMYTHLKYTLNDEKYLYINGRTYGQSYPLWTFFDSSNTPISYCEDFANDFIYDEIVNVPNNASYVIVNIYHTYSHDSSSSSVVNNLNGICRITDIKKPNINNTYYHNIYAYKKENGVIRVNGYLSTQNTSYKHIKVTLNGDEILYINGYHFSNNFPAYIIYDKNDNAIYSCIGDGNTIVEDIIKMPNNAGKIIVNTNTNAIENILCVKLTEDMLINPQYIFYNKSLFDSKIDYNLFIGERRANINDSVTIKDTVETRICSSLIPYTENDKNIIYTVVNNMPSDYGFCIRSFTENETNNGKRINDAYVINDNYVSANSYLERAWLYNDGALAPQTKYGNQTSFCALNGAKYFSIVVRKKNDAAFTEEDMFSIIYNLNIYKGFPKYKQTKSEIYHSTYNDILNKCELFSEAYAVAIARIQNTYKNAEIFTCTLLNCDRVTNVINKFPDTNAEGKTINDYNHEIKIISNIFAVKCIDLNKCGITYYNLDEYMYDFNQTDTEYFGLHPNAAGFELMANYITKYINTFGQYNDYTGKNVAIIGDSISTFTGYTPYGSTAQNYWNNCNRGGVNQVQQTWWYKSLITDLHMNLLINNSYGGRSISSIRDDLRENTGVFHQEMIDMLKVNDTEPDVIIIFCGINDFGNVGSSVNTTVNGQVQYGGLGKYRGQIINI